MKDTKKESNQLKQLPIESALKESTQLMEQSSLQEKSEWGKPTSKSLSMNVAEHLLFLMKEVTRAEVDPRTVNAACNCASQMIGLMKINLKLRDV